MTENFQTTDETADSTSPTEIDSLNDSNVNAVLARNKQVFSKMGPLARLQPHLPLKKTSPMILSVLHNKEAERARALRTVVDNLRREHMLAEVENEKRNTASSSSFLTTFFQKLKEVLKQTSESENVSSKDTTSIPNDMRVYDILETILIQKKKKNNEESEEESEEEESCHGGCLISPEEQLLILKAFTRSGYFKPRTEIDVSKMRVIPGFPPPRVFSMSEYVHVMRTKCSSMLLALEEQYNVVFLILATNEMGGAGEGPWWCKSNLFTYLLYLKYDIKGVAGLNLVIAFPDEATPATLVDSLNPYQLMPDRDICFVLLADGVYSGLEAQNQANWWLEGISKMLRREIIMQRPAQMCIMTALAERPSRAFKGDILTPTELFQKSEGGRKLLEDYKDSPPLLAGEIFPGNAVKEHRKLPNVSFLLPFKIADSTSIGRYTSQLEQLNPDFRPPYRQNLFCDNEIQKKSLSERINLENKRWLQNIDPHAVDREVKRRRKL